MLFATIAALAGVGMEAAMDVIHHRHVLPRTTSFALPVLLPESSALFADADSVRLHHCHHQYHHGDSGVALQAWVAAQVHSSIRHDEDFFT